LRIVALKLEPSATASSERRTSVSPLNPATRSVGERSTVMWSHSAIR
jgi:hypothetical protein